MNCLPLQGGETDWGRVGMRWGVGRCEWATTVFRVGFFSRCSGVIRGCPYLVGAFGGVRICSDLFRVCRRG